MILFLHPRATKPKNRRFPLSILALAAMIEGREEYAIVDGNVESDPFSRLLEAAANKTPELLAVSVMPGPQMVAAIPVCRQFRERYPKTPIAWGGYFPSLYPDTALNAPYVDYVVRGQGDDTFVELLQALRGQREFSSVLGLSYCDPFGLHRHNPERLMRSPDDFPWPPFHRLDPAKYILPTFLGSRTTVHHASIGCPYSCNFCGVVPVHGSRQKMESPARTAAILAQQKERYAINAVQFYDNNFYLREEHAADLAERLTPLDLQWWSEGRVDIVLRYSDATLKALRRAGAAMIFFGAESGSDWVLAEMNKQLKAEQTLELARRIRDFGIVPEFSFVLGNPHDPERDVRETIAFVRKIKALNPDSEIIIQHYIPVPQRDSMYGAVDQQLQFPSTPDEWATERWYNFTIRTDPQLPWLPDDVKRRIDDFEQVVSSRWPTVQDIFLPAWGRVLLSTLASWRYSLGVYSHPFELQWAQRWVSLRKPRMESL